MTSKPRQTGVINVIDCITPKGNIVGYVNGKEYNGPFHVHPTTGVKMVGSAHTTSAHATIYNTPQESLGSTGSSSGTNVGSTQVKLSSIQNLIKESETTQSNESSGDSPPSSPPSSGSSGSGGGY